MGTENDLGIAVRTALPPITIIIPTFNRADSLFKTLVGFSGCDYPVNLVDLIVCDNNSNDHTVDAVASAKKTSRFEISYFRETRQGVHYARNSAAVRAKSELLYFTDDDMMPSRDVLREIASVFVAFPKVGMVTGPVLPRWLAPPPKWITKHCQNEYLSLGNKQELLIISRRDVGVYSCHQAIRKSVLLAAGGFNPENTGGSWIGDGESGLNLKAEQIGVLFAYNGNAVTSHLIPPERMTQQYLNQRFANQGASDGHTEFWRSRLSDAALRSRSLKLLKTLPYRGLLLAWRFLTCSSRWRIDLAYFYYVLSRVRYNRTLARDPDFKANAARTDWIATDAINV